jgi:hypothetical protein
VSAAPVERRRVRDHLNRALRAAQHRPPEGLGDDRRARRAAALRALARYIAAGRYPRNAVSPAMTPVFVDGEGNRCAVAALLEATGESALVARVARERNLATVRELADDPALVAWLDHHWLTVAEAARIQPAYSAHSEASYQPTVSVIASVAGGAEAGAGARFTVAPTGRVGVRRVTRGSDDNGNSEYGSVAFVAEYARSFVVGVGGAHQLGLMLQWEPVSNHGDAQWYLLGAPIAVLDEGAPDVAYGGEFGAGFSFRRRSVPLLFELMAQTIVGPSGVTARLALDVGAVW